MNTITALPILATFTAAVADRKVQFFADLEEGRYPELTGKETAIRKVTEGFDRALNCPNRFSDTRIENGLSKLFAGRNLESLYEDLKRADVPSMGSKKAHLSVMDLCMLVRLAAFVVGIKKENNESYGFNGRRLRKLGSIVPINYLVGVEMMVGDARDYADSVNGAAGKLIGSSFTLEQIKDAMHGSSAVTDASSLCQILRFCGLIDNKAYERGEMKMTADAVRLFRRYIMR